MKKFLLSAFSLFLFIALSLNVHAQISTDSLILDLHMDGDAIDYSGFDNHGTMHNVVADTNRFGMPNSSFMFNGTDSYIEIPASPSMNAIQTVDEVSITAWININQWHVSGNVFSIFERYNPNTDSGWLLEANWVGGGILFLADETNMNNWIGCNYLMNFDEWYHLGFTYSQAQGEAKFYINGENVCTSAYNPPIYVADTTSSFIIGRSLAGPDEYSDGHIDDYKIYYRILSPDEVDTVFTTGVSEHQPKPAYDVFPNPTASTLNIRTSHSLKGAEYVITDMTGRTFFSGNILKENTTIDVQSLPAGIYIVRVNGSGIVRKVMKT